MRKHSVAINLASVSRTIPYQPKLAKVTGSINSAILLQQVCYWWSFAKGGFYKFKMPCTHKWYNLGDSWTEELGMGESKYEEAMAKIGRKVDTLQQAKEILDGYHVNLNDCVIYFKDRQNVTWFYLNHKALEVVWEAVEELEEEFRAKVQASKDARFVDPMLELGGYGNTTPPEEKIASLFKNKEYTQEKSYETGETDVKKVKPKKEKTQEQLDVIKNQQKGKNMPFGFTLEDNTIDVAEKTGYNRSDVLDEMHQYVNYYTNGQGKSKKFCDWDTNFIHGWLLNNYRWGKLKRNGKFYKLDANEERLETLRRQSTTDLFAHITD